MKRLKFVTSLAVLAAILAAPLSAIGAEKKNEKAPKAKPYPLSACAVSDEKFGGEMGEPYVFVHEGREVKLCCKSCLKGFKKDTAAIIGKIDEAAKKVKPYKAKTCLISGEELGGHGDPYVFIHEGQEVKLCCKACIKDFNKDPKKWMKKVSAAK